MKPTGKILITEPEVKFKEIEVSRDNMYCTVMDKNMEKLKEHFEGIQTQSEAILKELQTSNSILKRNQEDQQIHYCFLSNSLNRQEQQLKNHIDDELANNVRIVTTISNQTDIIKQVVDFQNRTNDHIYALTLEVRTILEYMKLPWYKKLFHSFK